MHIVWNLKKSKPHSHGADQYRKKRCSSGVTAPPKLPLSVTLALSTNTAGLGYKFETLSTLPAPWGETSREYIENRENEVVNNEAQYCSVVRTGIGKTVLCLGGEVDASMYLT